MIVARYFSETEFRRCTPSCSLQDMDSGTMAKLDYARELAGIPFVLNSAYRSKAWELGRGRTGTSSHCKGKAVDIRCNSYSNRWKVVNALIKAGFTRIGIGKTYIHADTDTSKQQEVIWDYYG